ncbi:hypothetical protein MLD38_003156 [Melastoma candidum]|uniref:Uncharacterized protein n=1 Tax=Melastoma candidum TaxID=119954 RepID=A0ACB9S164_9MYRT|nr:hypothetical protein MLD38_003156 [Melastoma candidum]
MESSASDRRPPTTVDRFFGVDTPHFIKVILEAELRNKILRIPRLFVDRHGGCLSDPVRLEVPTGRAWELALHRDDVGLYLHDGWAGFMEECRVGLGYLLLFRHERDSRFFVVVLDITTCEIEYPSRHDVGVRTGSGITQRVWTGHPGKEVVKIEDTDNEDGIGDCDKGGGKKPSRCSDRPSKKSRNGQRGVKVPTIASDRSSLEAPQGKLANVKQGAKEKMVPIDVTDRSVEETRLEASTKEISEPQQQISSTESRSLRKPAEFGGRAAADEKSEAFLRASAFLCENTACVVRIRCLGCLHLSKKFLMACFPGKKEFGDIICVSETRLWTLGINKSQCPRFRRGWTGFVADNNLRVGDACVFELIDIAEAMFRVVIFHDKCTKPPERKPLRRETSTEKSTINDRGEVESADYEECPFFTMVITKTSARHSVHVPTTFARSHLPTIQAAENVKASLKYKGLSWPVALYSRECCGSAYTMIKGWQKFRKGNGFQLGEELLFELIDKNDLVFRVSIPDDGEGQDCCDC